MWHFSISYHFSFYSFDWIILKTTIGLCWFVFVSLLEWICYLTLLIISSRIIFFISKYLWDSFLYFIFIDDTLLMCCFLTCAYYVTYFKFVVNPFMCNLLGLIFLKHFLTWLWNDFLHFPMFFNITKEAEQNFQSLPTIMNWLYTTKDLCQ